MKTMTCKQLGGACELEFHAETFEEIAKLGQKHGKEMFEKGDKAPHSAMNNCWMTNKALEPPQNTPRVFAMTPCRGLSLSR